MKSDKYLHIYFIIVSPCVKENKTASIIQLFLPETFFPQHFHYQ